MRPWMSVGARVTVDGEECGVAPLAGRVWVAPGRHRAEATKAGFSAAALEVELRAGAERVVSLSMQPTRSLATPGPAAAVPAPAPTVAAVPPVALAPAPEPEPVPAVASSPEPAPPPQRGRFYTWIAAGATGLLAGGAVVAGMMTLSRANDCGEVGCTNADVDSLRNRALAAEVLGGLAGAALVTTGVLWWWERPVEVSAGPTGAVVHGRF